MKRTSLRVAFVSTLLAALSLSVSPPAAADMNNWIILIRATDMNGLNYAGTLRLGWRVGYTNDTEWNEMLPPAPPVPGQSLATIGSFHSDGNPYLLDFRTSATLDSSEKVYDLAVWNALGDSGTPLNQIKVAFSASSTSVYPYAGNFTHIIVRWQDGGSWYEKVFSPQDHLPTTGWSFIVAAKTTYSPDNPDIIVIAGVPEPGSIVTLLCGIGGMGTLALRRKRLYK
ncbi:MAG: PEP-CTERM sorting domain-containing protein [Armatimonadetes bacterium]|nr:PEP-CTERM sorting domain-containing protein [Armatimonadota bacterium]